MYRIAVEKMYSVCGLRVILFYVSYVFLVSLFEVTVSLFDL